MERPAEIPLAVLKMTSEQVRTVIETEIGDDWSRTNWHGCDLRRCLVVPALRDYADPCQTQPSGPPPIVKLWLVLEELPDDRSGYKIVFSEQHRKFGLAVPGSPRDVFIGFYGTFLETYAAM